MKKQLSYHFSILLRMETTRNHQILDPICCYITFYSNTLGKREIVPEDDNVIVIL